MLTQFVPNEAPAAPDPLTAKELHKAVKSHIRQKLARDVGRCGEKLRIDVRTLKAAIEEWQPSEKWSPERFLRTSMLEIAMRSGEVTAILDQLQAIRRLLAKPGDDACAAPFVSTILTEDWEAEYVPRMREYRQKNIRGEPTLVRPIFDDVQLATHAENIQVALKLIREHDPQLAGEFDELVIRIKIFDGRVLRGESSPQTFGAMWIRIPPVEDDQVGYWVEHIVHELSHIRLFALAFFDELVLNPREECKYEAPIRDDPRPMYGVFHASFVLARMSRVFHRLSLAGFDARFRDRLQLIRLQLDRGLKTLSHPDAKFTPQGTAIRDHLETCAVN